MISGYSCKRTQSVKYLLVKISGKYNLLQNSQNINTLKHIKLLCDKIIQVSRNYEKSSFSPDMR